MALLLKNGSVFLHVPKTGGAWVTSVLESQGLIERRIAEGHADMDRALLWFARRRWRSKPSFIFCFVRNPLSWYESWFRFMSLSKWNWMQFGTSASGSQGWHPNYLLNGCGSDDFNTFVRNVIRARPGYVTEMLGWYTKPPISFVGKQENLDADLVDALKQAQLPFDEGAVPAAARVNEGGESIGIEWDPALRAEVIRLEYAAFVRYGYDPI
jgi:hypothetical protein